MYEIIGIERLNYKNKQGRQISGWKVYFTYDLPNGVEHNGSAADSVFLSDSVFVQSGVGVGDKAMPIYDKRGHCQGFMESI